MGFACPIFGRPIRGERMANPTPVSDGYPNQLRNGRPNKMKLFSIKNLAMTGALSVAGLGLIGVGAHAVFTQNTTSQQTITAGTMNVTVHSDGANSVVSGDNTAALTLNPISTYEGSSFAEVYHVIMTNNGNIPVSEVSFQLGATNDGSGPSSVMQADRK